jgi:hypothetical protein
LTVAEGVLLTNSPATQVVQAVQYSTPSAEYCDAGQAKQSSPVELPVKLL